MFVSYNEESCFDIKREESCCVVCGLDSSLTNQTGENTGYCGDCAEIRNAFIEQETGVMRISTEWGTPLSPFNNQIFSSLEKIRINTFRERFNYIVDKYYFNDVSHDQPKSLDQNNELMIIILKEKVKLYDNFINSLKGNAQKRSVWYRLISTNAEVSTIYYYYVKSLIKEQNETLKRISTYTKTIKEQKQLVKIPMK